MFGNRSQTYSLQMVLVLLGIVLCAGLAANSHLLCTVSSQLLQPFPAPHIPLRVMDKLGSHLFQVTAQQFISDTFGLSHTSSSDHHSESSDPPVRDVLSNPQDNFLEY